MSFSPSHLILPCPHVHPDHSNERFKWFANLIIDLQPTHVICLGDFADMPSLCSYDKGTKGFNNRRYQSDIDHVHEALNLIRGPLVARKKKLPKFFMLHGNHDHRIERAINADAVMLDGTISLNDLHYKDYGWEVIPYSGSTPGVLELDGISYAHFFTSGVMGRPIGGEHAAHTLLTKQFKSVTQAHIHTTDYCMRSDATKKHVQALVAGCYIDYYADWAGNANDLWWRGVVFKENVSNGTYDPSWIRLSTIKKEYSCNGMPKHRVLMKNGLLGIQ